MGGGEGTITLTHPWDVAVNATGYVYVTESDTHRVRVLNPAPGGTVVGGWGSLGGVGGELNAPVGIAIDGAGAVYVADYGNQRVQKFSPGGTYLAAWGTMGTAPGEFEFPWGVAVGGDGTVFVTDNRNHRVQRFRPVAVIPGGSSAPTDTNADGMFDDVNGNGRKDFADVVLYFNQMSWIPANEPVTAFDYNGNNRIDIADVVWLFNHL